MHKKNTIMPILVFLAIVFMRICVNHFGISTNESEQRNENIAKIKAYQISYNAQYQNVPITDYDITDRYVFFSYSENRSVVEAYDLKGNYAFSINFANQQNGSVLVQSEGKQVFIRTKQDYVFVFDGDQLVEIIDAQTAQQRGYDYEWFSSKQSRVKIIGIRLHILNDAGDIEQSIPVPGRIIANFYKKYAVLFTMAIFLFVVIFRRITAAMMGVKR